MFDSTILRNYAQKNPVTIPPSVLFTHTSTSLTIYDVFPKSIFHLLLLPRIQEPHTASDLANLRLLLQTDKARAKELLTALNEDAKAVRVEIEIEMVKRYGFKWGIWTGFHAVPSME
jgi:aprataxin